MAERPCPVCDGAGKWDRETGIPVYGEALPNRPTHTCPYCKGAKVVQKGY